MLILHSLLSELKEEFAQSRKGEERGPWFTYTLLAIILPFTSSRTSNLLRALETLFGFTIKKKKYYRFMASPKIPWNKLWIRLWKLVPEPETNGRLLVALDDFINPKSGKKSLVVPIFLTMRPNRISRNIPGRRMLLPSGFLKQSRAVGHVCL